MVAAGAAVVVVSVIASVVLGGCVVVGSDT